MIKPYVYELSIDKLKKFERILWGFKFPPSYIKIAEAGSMNAEHWFLLSNEHMRGIYPGLRFRYRKRKLVPFAKRDDCDDLACFEIGKGGRVFVIHDYADAGWEQRQEYDTFWEWYIAAISEKMNEEDEIYYADLSKEVSYMLRHAPHEYGLALDEQGWVDLSEVVSALKRTPRFKNLVACDVESMVNKSDKKRHEIKDGKIRALYGHTLPEKIAKIPAVPPDALYHGTPRKSVDSILKTGLLPKARQYVHLSKDKETALMVGRRRDSRPVVLEVDARRAWDAGILFYEGNDGIWLSDTILPEYIKMTGSPI